MDRRTFVCTLTGTLRATPLAAEAQQAGRVYRIGVLMNTASDPAESRQWQGLWLGLRERGWIQGENILIELREAEGNSSRVPGLAADLVADKKGDDRKAFMSECLKAGAPAAPMTQQDKMKACNTKAADKKGDERKTFMSECLKADKKT